MLTAELLKSYKERENEIGFSKTNLNDMEKQELYTTQEVAEMLKVHQRTIFRHIKTGQLKAVKILGRWRIKKNDLDKLIE